MSDSNGPAKSKSKSAKKPSNAREASHYVVTAQPPGGVLCSAKCNFLSAGSEDVIIAKSRRLEIRQLRGQNGGEDDDSAAPFPVILSLPINGRIMRLVPLKQPGAASSLFFITDQMQYAVIAYDASISPYPVVTLSSGKLDSSEWSTQGRKAECGPVVAVDPHMRCLVVHLHDGLLTIFRILQPGGSITKYKSGAAKRSANMLTSSHPVLAPPFHTRIEERTVLSLTLLHHPDPTQTPPHVCLLHQDSRGAQHITTHAIDLAKSQLWFASGSSSINPPSSCEWLKKSRIDGGSSLLIPVAPRTRAVAAAAGTGAAGGNKISSSPSQSAAPSGGVVILGQRQITYCASNLYKVMPIPVALILDWDVLPPDDSTGMPRYLLGDEYGNLHMLTLLTASSSASDVLRVIGLQLDTLGSCTLCSTLEYLGQGIVYVGATLGDAQLVQIHDEPIPLDDGGVELGDTTYLTVIEEYTNLGPIVDFDLVPTTPGGHKNSDTSGAMHQSQVVMASGSSKVGSLRIVRNGIGMNEYACVSMSGIQHMWSLRKTFTASHDAYLVQSFVGETRVLGVTSTSDEDPMVTQGNQAEREEDEEEEAGGTLEEVLLSGLESNATTLYAGNIIGDLMLQITESELRLIGNTGELLDSWSPSVCVDDATSPITVAAANESGQIVISMRGGLVTYFQIIDQKIVQVEQTKMDREVSCMNLNPFMTDDKAIVDPSTTAMQVEGDTDHSPRVAYSSSFVVIGLWDDFTVRILSLDSSNLLKELLQIHLSTTGDGDGDEAKDDSAEEHRRNRNNMMARSLCLVTLDYSSSSTATSAVENNIPTADNKVSDAATPGADMLFVGLGDGTVVSFAVVQPKASEVALAVQSKKEVSLGTQRISLVPLRTERGGTCILATGDRPTVIYLAGVGNSSTGQNYNPKLCYSNVNLSPTDEEVEPELNAADVSRGHSQQNISVNVAAPFFSPLLFDTGGDYSLCVADDENLRLGVIDDIQKLHVTTCLLGMAPRRVVHCPEGRLYAVGCIESGIKIIGKTGNEMNMGNCIRFLDETTLEDIERIDMDMFEMILSMQSVSIRFYPPSFTSIDVEGAVSGIDNTGLDLSNEYHQFLFVGTAYALPDEDEPNKGRILVYSCDAEEGAAAGSASRSIKLVAELQVRGGVYSMTQFFNGQVLISMNSKTQVCQLSKDITGVTKVQLVGVGHHGHILSLVVRSRAEKKYGMVPGSDDAHDKPDDSKKSKNDDEEEEQLAIVGDLMRSVSLVNYYPQYETVEEVAHDFNTNWTTAVEMLTDDIYVGCESWSNLFVLRRNTKSASEEVRCRLDTVGQFHLGEMCNKFMSGSLIMPYGSSSTATNTTSKGKRSIAAPTKQPSSQDGKESLDTKMPSSNSTTAITTRSYRPTVAVGSQTLFGTVDGTLGIMLGMDRPTAAFFSTLERAMSQVIKPVGDLMHEEFRASGSRPAYGFVDGDLVEAFLDLDRGLMELVVDEMNRDGGWEADDSAYAAAKATAKRTQTEDEMDTSGSAVNANSGKSTLELSVEDVLAVVEEMAMLH